MAHRTITTLFGKAAAPKRKRPNCAPDPAQARTARPSPTCPGSGPGATGTVTIAPLVHGAGKSADPLSSLLEDYSVSDSDESCEELQQNALPPGVEPASAKKAFTSKAAARVDACRAGMRKSWADQHQWLACTDPTTETVVRSKRTSTVFLLAPAEARWQCKGCSNPALRGVLKAPDDDLSKDGYRHSSATRPDTFTVHSKNPLHIAIWASVQLDGGKAALLLAGQQPSISRSLVAQDELLGSFFINVYHTAITESRISLVTANQAFLSWHKVKTAQHYLLHHHCTFTAPSTAPSLHHHCVITAQSAAPSLHHHSTIVAPSLHHRLCHHCSITAPLLHHHFTTCCTTTAPSAAPSAAPCAAPSLHRHFL